MKRWPEDRARESFDVQAVGALVVLFVAALLLVALAFVLLAGLST